jgi:hypothetical protein
MLSSAILEGAATHQCAKTRFDTRLLCIHLTVRDTASAPSYLALIPPDQHIGLSVATTLNMLGVSLNSCLPLGKGGCWDEFIKACVHGKFDMAHSVERAQRSMLTLLTCA